jgi:ketosteroid isomerase-like protein
MGRVCALLVSALLGISIHAAGQPSRSAEDQRVTQIMEAMARATSAKDRAALEKLYHKDLTYSHSNGRTQTKDEVLASLSGSTIFDSIAFSDTTIRIFGDVALFKGVTHILAHSPTQKYDTYLNILWVLVKGPTGWQIVARQPTAIAAPSP